MDLLPEPFRTLLSFLVVLGVLVFIHELGHYLAARWRGVYVERFSIGFGRAIATWQDRRGTEWRIAWLPLGGYVKLHGQEGVDDATPEQRAAWRPGETFHEKSVLDRAIVVAAGPIANFALAVLLFAGLFATIGQPVATTVIATVAEGSAAARAGLQPGDRILALDGTPVSRFEEVQRHILPRAGVPMEIRVARAGGEEVLRATPEARPDSAEGRLGVGGGVPEFRRIGPVAALGVGAAHTWEVTVQTLSGLWQMISGQRGTEELGGPLRIAQLSGQVATMGLASLVSFIAVLSVNLGLINLFPVPVLDGGHLVFYAMEALRGRPLPPRAMEYGFRAGFALLVALFVFATWNDLASFGVFRWAAALFG